MYRISDKQIDHILNDISARGIKTEDLQFNLLDHVCCFIEQNLEADGDFERFYSETIKTFYKKELQEIEEETIQLLTHKNYYAMKKIMIISGALSAALLTMGTIFKFFHLMGASFGLLTGIGIFSLIFLPLVLLLKVKEGQNTRDRFITVIGVLSGTVMSLGILFKLFHWPGGNVCIISGTATFSLVFLPLLLILKVREMQDMKDRLSFSLGLLAAMVLSISILFKIVHWPGADILNVTAIPIIGLLFLPIYFFTGYRNMATRLNTIITSVLIVGGCGLLLSLVRVPRSVHQQEIADTSRYVQNEKMLETEQKQLQQILKSGADNSAIPVISKDINSSCEELKACLIESATSSKTIDADFQSKHLFIPDGTAEAYLAGQPVALEKLSSLKKSVDAYNETISKTNSGNLQPIPITSTILDKTDDKIVNVLNDLVRIQMLILQNDREQISIR